MSKRYQVILVYVLYGGGKHGCFVHFFLGTSSVCMFQCKIELYNDLLPLVNNVPVIFYCTFIQVHVDSTCLQ